MAAAVAAIILSVLRDFVVDWRQACGKESLRYNKDGGHVKSSPYCIFMYLNGKERNGNNCLRIAIMGLKFQAQGDLILRSESLGPWSSCKLLSIVKC